MRIYYFILLLVFIACSEEGELEVCPSFTISSVVLSEDFCDQTVSYEFTSTGTDQTQWDFGDGSTAIGRVVEHTYTEGQFNVEAISESECPSQEVLITAVLMEPTFNTDLILTPPPYFTNSIIDLNQTGLTSADVVEITDPNGNVISFNGDEVPSDISIDSPGQVDISIMFCSGSQNQITYFGTIDVTEEQAQDSDAVLSFSQANVESYMISRIPFPDKVDTFFEIDVDGELMHRTATFVWDGNNVTAMVPSDLIVGEGPLTGFTSNSVLTLRLFVDDNLFMQNDFTDIVNLDQFGPFTNADGIREYLDLEFGDNDSNYSIRFASFN